MKIEPKFNLNPARQSDDRYIPQQFKDIAQGYESQFVRLMLEEMRKSAPPVEEVSTAQDYYNQITDDERAKILSEVNGGLGVSKLVLDQIYPQKFRNKASYDSYLKILDQGKVSNQKMKMGDPKGETL